MLLLVTTLTVLLPFTSGSSEPNTPVTSSKTNADHRKHFNPSSSSSPYWNASSLFAHYSGCLPDYSTLDCYPATRLNGTSLQRQNRFSAHSNSAAADLKIGVKVTDPKEYCAATFEYATCLIDVACSSCNMSVVVVVERFCTAAFKADGEAHFCKHYVQMNDLLGRCTGRAIRGWLLAEVIAAVLVITALNCLICACFCCMPCQEVGYEMENQKKDATVVNKNVIINEN